jgi:hypothetical protein
MIPARKLPIKHASVETNQDELSATRIYLQAAKLPLDNAAVVCYHLRKYGSLAGRIV